MPLIISHDLGIMPGPAEDLVLITTKDNLVIDPLIPCDHGLP